MDHEGTREQLELAAVEPGGLERLMAGDTPTAQAVAAHLAGCSSCTDELMRLQRASTLIRASVSEMPPADLKEKDKSPVATPGSGEDKEKEPQKQFARQIIYTAEMVISCFKLDEAMQRAEALDRGGVAEGARFLASLRKGIDG